MNKYIKLLRLDHWIKQLFIFPGVVAAYVLCKDTIFSYPPLYKIVIGFFSTCFIASSNYIINEWLDAKFDKYHPTKKNRSVVQNNVDKRVVYFMYFLTCLIGLILGRFVSFFFFINVLVLWIMGVIYNVKPFRTKDIPFVDVLSESINNAIRFLLGWFIITSEYLPPVSIVIGYWFAGAFLMSTKRYSEYRMINDPNTAGLYRKSFKYYNENILMIFSFFNAMISILFAGIFLVKYKVELILFMPFFIGLFCYYFHISFKEDSAAQKPEKLYKEKGLIIYVFILICLFVLLMMIKLPGMNELLSDSLIKIKDIVK